MSNNNLMLYYQNVVAYFVGLLTTIQDVFSNDYVLNGSDYEFQDYINNYNLKITDTPVIKLETGGSHIRSNTIQLNESHDFERKYTIKLFGTANDYERLASYFNCLEIFIRSAGNGNRPTLFFYTTGGTETINIDETFTRDGSTLIFYIKKTGLNLEWSLNEGTLHTHTLNNEINAFNNTIKYGNSGAGGTSSSQMNGYYLEAYDKDVLHYIFCEETTENNVIYSINSSNNGNINPSIGDAKDTRLNSEPLAIKYGFEIYEHTDDADDRRVIPFLNGQPRDLNLGAQGFYKIIEAQPNGGYSQVNKVSQPSGNTSLYDISVNNNLDWYGIDEYDPLPLDYDNIDSINSNIDLTTGLEHMCLGDSTAGSGWDVYINKKQKSNRTRQSYPGARTETILTSLQTDVGSDPTLISSKDMITYISGFNDYGQGISEIEFTEDLDNLIQYLLSENPTVKIVLCGLYDFINQTYNPTGDSDTPNNNGLTYNIIRDVVESKASEYNLEYCNWNDANIIYPDDIPDGTHTYTFTGNKKLEIVIYESWKNIYIPAIIDGLEIDKTIDIINRMIVKE